MSGEHGGQFDGPSHPTQRPGNAARLATSEVELRLMAAGILLRKGVELQHVPVSAICDSLLSKGKRFYDHVAHDATPNVLLRAISLMFHNAVQLL